MESTLLTHIMIANPWKRKFLNMYMSTYEDHTRYNQWRTYYTLWSSWTGFHHIKQSKSAEVTLNVFKSFYTEAEHQTGKRLRRVQLDIGREWYNNIWEHYRDEQGLDFEFTTPYAHQQNGATEWSIQTILDGTQMTMAESGLPMKYWADTVQTVVYVQNLLPSL